MLKRRSSRMLAVAILAAMAAVVSPPVALGNPITAVVVYGDSLSDNGNLHAAIGYPPSPPYWNGRASNGPVAVEYLASRLGVPLVDYAWYGATTGVGNFADGGTPTSFGALSLPGMLTTFNATQGSLAPYTGALFVVDGGANDVWGASPLDNTPQKMIARTVGDLLTIVYGLQGLGATNILVPGLPDLGLTPYFQSLGSVAAAQASAYTDALNAALVANLPAGVTYFDQASLLRAVVANPAAYGFTNVTMPCFDGTTVCSHPENYVFFDSVHPTTAAQAIFADRLASTVVPEPASLLLLSTGLAGLARWRRRRT